ncbi:MAG: HAD-IIIA family hydrolase [Planctomycetota bacterium]
MDRASSVQLLVMDVDGVLTDGSIMLDNHGNEIKRFHVRDGAGLRLWQHVGYATAIITGRRGMALRHRVNELGIDHVIQGSTNKAQDLEDLAEDLDLDLSEIAMIGDDLPDLGVMKCSGYPVAVADAAAEVRAVADYVTTAPGGRGAVRETIEHLLKARDEWKVALRMYG